MAMSFSSWEQQIINSPGYPNNNEVRLAIQTLKVCITESPITNDEIARNGYALFDYVMFCYFVFRAELCSECSRNFVSLYDAYTQNLLALYFNQFFNISQDTIIKLITSRANEYESLIRNDNAVYDILEALSQYILKDFSGTPEYDGLIIAGFDKNIELHLKLSNYTQETLTALDKEKALLLCEKNEATTEEAPTSQYSQQLTSDKKAEEHVPEATPKTTEQVEQVSHNIRPAKKLRSKKPAIIVTYVLLIAIIIALSSFCFSTVKVIKIQYDNMNRLADDVYALESELKSAESKLKRKESDLKVAYGKISDNNLTLQNKEEELKTAKSDIEYWKNKYMATDPANVTYSYEFTSVNALLTAIKNAPEAYHNKQAKVFGMILTYESLTFDRKEIALIDNKGESLPDTDDFAARYLYRKKAEAKEAIDVILSSDLQYTVAETGDYVNLYGIVKITNGEVYLDKCQYN